MDMSKWTDLTSWRKKVGISQQKLAHIAKISLGTVRKIEAGVTKPHKKTLKKLKSAVKEISTKFQKPDESGVVKVRSSAKKADKGNQKERVIVNEVAKSQAESAPISLTNLDLELINRILRMSGQEKLSLLQKLML